MLPAGNMPLQCENDLLERLNCAMSKQPAKVISILSGKPVSEKIADLAFQFWLARCFRNGSPEEDFLRAVREIRFRWRWMIREDNSVLCRQNRTVLEGSRVQTIQSESFTPDSR